MASSAVLDPYFRVWALQLRNQRRLHGWLPIVQGFVVPLVVAAVLVPLVRPLFLAWLDRPSTEWAGGMAQVLLRASVVVVGVLALDVYGAVVRGPDRRVLEGMPVDPAGVVRWLVARVALRRWWLVPSAAIVLLPVAVSGASSLWALGVGVLVGGYFLGLAASGAVHLLAIEVAESPRFAPVLDLLRGNNPRPQAAFLYAPGVVLLVVGLALARSSMAAGEVWAGASGALLWILLPLPLAVLAWGAVPELARRTWFRGTAVLSEVDARYAALVDREEGLRVYLDWAVRFLPQPVRIHALRDLRHGWRARRTPITGAWMAGLAALAAGWTSAEAGPARAAVVVVAAVFACAVIGVLLEADEPDFLRVWLPRVGAAPVVGRAVVLLLWLAPAIALGVASVWIRRGAGDALWLLGVGFGSAVAATGLAGLCSQLQRHGLAVYVPLAAVCAAGIAGWVAVGEGL